MIQRQLSKPQGHVIAALAREQAELQQHAAEVQAAVQEQAEMLRRHYELPEGQVAFQPAQDGWVIVVQPQEDEGEAVEDEDVTEG